MSTGWAVGKKERGIEPGESSLAVRVKTGKHLGKVKLLLKLGHLLPEKSRGNFLEKTTITEHRYGKVFRIQVQIE